MEDRERDVIPRLPGPPRPQLPKVSTDEQRTLWKSRLQAWERLEVDDCPGALSFWFGEFEKS